MEEEDLFFRTNILIKKGEQMRFIRCKFNTINHLKR